jgi:hypothetical protein
MSSFFEGNGRLARGGAGTGRVRRSHFACPRSSMTLFVVEAINRRVAGLGRFSWPFFHS